MTTEYKEMKIMWDVFYTNVIENGLRLETTSLRKTRPSINTTKPIDPGSSFQTAAARRKGPLWAIRGWTMR